MLTITDLHKSYPTPQGPLPVLHGVDLHLGQGESLALMGESGSGKSTLLHLVAGLDRPDRGRIEAAGQTLSALDERALARWRREGIGLIFQQFNLIASLSVADNLAFQARLAHRHDPRWQQILAERLGLAALLDRYPEQLSGGQQQRVALGRALASRPPLLLADEPTGNLDEGSGDQALALLLELVAETGSSLLMVTHSARIACHLDRTLHLARGRLVLADERGP
ncbi:ABC transporter ATP-binding protein [Pseudomonas sp. EpS/L25]|uniref:ABC transporter ATP-binding protein n=1 Tax=Pseudomonas sp. EpS/L25 TaxID=1749078 RepID=UPI000743523C|nr:ABC transporter ATP-binding protein [Pseudomonas sp. EpS/L25]KUM41993.1 ABC transporter ATP-binding protein [Pseudomonas sp. EpS/L25]